VAAVGVVTTPGTATAFAVLIANRKLEGDGGGEETDTAGGGTGGGCGGGEAGFVDGDETGAPGFTTDGAVTREVPVDSGRLAAAKAVFRGCMNVVAALEMDAKMVFAAAVDDDVTENATTTPPWSKCRPLGAAVTEVIVMVLAGTEMDEAMAAINAP